MVSRGRPRVPDNLHALRGTLRKDRHGDPETKTKAVEKEPKPPADFTKEQRQVWRRLAGLLKPLHLWSETYSILMELFCRAFSRYIECERNVDEEGIKLIQNKIDAQGNHIEIHKTNPTQNEAGKLRKQLVVMLTEMGLTASSLSKLRPADKAQPFDPLADLEPSDN